MERFSDDCTKRVDQMQKVVGGYFELLPIDPRCATMVFVNEEGRLNGSAINMAASMWLHPV